MKSYLFFCCSLILLFLSSCGAAAQFTHFTPDKIKGLDLGMNRNEVLEILGPDYTITRKEIVDQDTIEVVYYQGYVSDQRYLFQFKNNKLDKWEKEIQRRQVLQYGSDLIK